MKPNNKFDIIPDEEGICTDTNVNIKDLFSELVYDDTIHSDIYNVEPLGRYNGYTKEIHYNHSSNGNIHSVNTYNENYTYDENRIQDISDSKIIRIDDGETKLDTYKSNLINFILNEDIPSQVINDVYWDGENMIKCINYYKIAELIDDSENNLSLESLGDTHDQNCEYYNSDSNYDCQCDNLRISVYRRLKDVKSIMVNDDYPNPVIMTRYTTMNNNEAIYNFRIYVISEDNISYSVVKCACKIVDNYSYMNYINTQEIFSYSDSDSENFVDDSESYDYSEFMSEDSYIDYSYDKFGNNYITSSIFDEFI